MHLETHERAIPGCACSAFKASSFVDFSHLTGQYVAPALDGFDDTGYLTTSFIVAAFECQIDQSSNNIRLLDDDDNVYATSAEVKDGGSCGTSYLVNVGSTDSPGFKYQCLD